MVENTCLITDKPPKNLEYVQKLLEYDKETTLYEKFKKKITRSNNTRPHTKSQWCQILGSSKTNPQTRSFLEKLIQNKALVKEEEQKDGTELYKLDKDRLEELAFQDPYYNMHRDFFFRIINNQEPNKKIVNDF